MGRKVGDPILQHEKKFLHYSMESNANGEMGIRVHYKDQEHCFTPEQITAMLFTKLKEIAEKGLQTKVNDCVISVSTKNLFSLNSTKLFKKSFSTGTLILHLF
jgi:heat shock protein 110kDa